MARTSLKYSILLIPFALLASGCDEKKPQAANPGVAVQGKGGPVKLFDPLETEKELRNLKQPARWSVAGKDRHGRDWEGYLFVEHLPEKFMTVGFFEWGCNSGSGRYRFEGAFDPVTRKVKWTGFTIEDRHGAVANAHYEAILSEDGQKLIDGTWHGGISIPGTWHAELLTE